MNCHFCQVEIAFNRPKLMAASSRWAIQVPLLQSSNSECRSQTEARYVQALLWCLDGSPSLCPKTGETVVLASSITERPKGHVVAPLVLRLILTCALAFALSVSSSARPQGQALGSDDAQTAGIHSSSAETGGAPIEIDGRPIFRVQASVGGLAREERAEKIQQRILNIAKRNDIRVADIGVVDPGVWPYILAVSTMTMRIPEDDAKAAGRSRAQLGAEYAEIIRRTVATYRQEHTWRAVVRGVIAS